MEDNRIVELYLLRDESAIRQTMEKYGKRLRYLAYHIVNNRQVAEECENDTYMEAWNLIPPHEPKDYLYAFLARITRHIALNCCRHRNRLKRSALISELGAEMELCIPAPDDVACRIDEMALSQAINSFLGKLDEKKRNIFVRRYWYLDSVADISKRYDLSESKVKTTLHRCRNRLRKHLEEEGYTL
ncbi:MAG: RNA polymerase sigma factor [Clostridia bacterium]|nr:RNA polymerase sigma factor [Clostridia bacterium]